jgi:hypothetical protein
MFLLATSTPVMAAQNEGFSTRSAYLGPKKDLSAAVRQPRGVSPKSTDFHLVIDVKPVGIARDMYKPRSGFPDLPGAFNRAVTAVEAEGKTSQIFT